jgi:hypothetical protein
VTLAPGLYTFVRCNSHGTFLSEPPPPADSNLTCATAGSGSYRIYDGGPRYYRFTTPPTPLPLNVSLQITSEAPPTMRAGAYWIEVQATCDSAASNVFQEQGSQWFNGDTRSYPIGTLQGNTTYFVKLTNIDPGLKLSVSFTLN